MKIACSCGGTGGGGGGGLGVLCVHCGIRLFANHLSSF